MQTDARRRAELGRETPHVQEQSVRFDEFELDVRSRELRRGETLVRLQEQPFEILRRLLECPGATVTREDLCRRLWPEGTFVDFEHSLNAAVKRLRAALGDDADRPRFIETLPRRGYRLIAHVPGAVSDTAAALPAHDTRIAVLPFTNLSEDASQEYFSDGMTEELIAQLGRLCGGRIGVLARTSCVAVRLAPRSVREVGAMLNVGYVLEGSVRREGERVRITARLVETAGETHLWAETYQRNLDDCLVVQSEVAAHIARSLAAELLPAGPQPGDTRAPAPAAYQAYLKGRYYWNKPGDEGLAEAVHFFDQATTLDPGFAVAFASKARVLVAQAEYYNGQPRRLLEEARRVAEHARHLDPSHWRAYVALGDVRRLLEWNWRGAEEAYRTALALNPSNHSAHRAYGLLLAALGRRHEAVREADRALALDPLCLVIGTSAAWVRYAVGDYEAAIERCLHLIEMDERYGYAAARRLLGAAYLQAGRSGEALGAFERAMEEGGAEPIQMAWLAHARGVTGDRRGAGSLIDGLLAQQREGAVHVAAYHLALAWTGMGEHDAAFRSLDDACEDRDPVLSSVAIEPRFRPLYADPRFAGLLARLRLPASSGAARDGSHEALGA